MAKLNGLTQIEAAALLSVAPRTLRDWHDAPRNSDGSYPGPALVAYYVAKISGGADYDDQRQRLAAAQSEKVEMENAVKRGELARREDVVRFWSDCQAAARAKFLGIGTTLAPRLVNIADANVIAAAIRAAVCTGLAEFADYEPRRPDGVVEVDATSEDAAAGSDGQPMGRPRKKAVNGKQRRAGAVAD